MICLLIMEFGVCLPNYGNDISPDGLKRFAIAAEELGYTSVWTTDHILLNTESVSPYKSIVESVTTLAYIAGSTRRVKLGISSLIISMRNPIITTKQLATIDFLSDGRLTVAIGTGWNKEEFFSLGANFHDRGTRTSESIGLIRALWSGKANFESVHLKERLSDAIFLPKPVQERLPIWVAGASEAAMSRAARLGDAWHPNLYNIGVFEKLVERFREISSEKDKPIYVRAALSVDPKERSYRDPQGEERPILSCSGAGTAELIERLKEQRISGVILSQNSSGTRTIGEQIRCITSFAGSYLY